MKYFDIVPDPAGEHSWHLEDPVYLKSRRYYNFWPLIAGEPDRRSFNVKLDVPIQYKGRKTNFTLGAWLLPYVRNDIGEVCVKFGHGDVRLLPCLIGGKDLDHSILVVERKIECLDRKRSWIDFYTEEDLAEEEERDRDPAKLGTIKCVIDIRVNTKLIPPDAHIFRLSEQLNDLIVSQQLKTALQRKGVTGIAFERV